MIGILAVARDITNMPKFEDELKDLKNNLEILVKQRVKELIIANKELAFQKEKRAAEMLIANKELAVHNKEILFMSHHDFLTNLYNRIFFETEKNALIPAGNCLN